MLEFPIHRIEADRAIARAQCNASGRLMSHCGLNRSPGDPAGRSMGLQSVLSGNAWSRVALARCTRSLWRATARVTLCGLALWANDVTCFANSILISSGHRHPIVPHFTLPDYAPEPQIWMVQATEPRAQDEEKAWEQTSKQDSISAYIGFLESFPSGVHAADARKRQKELEDAAGSKSGGTPLPRGHARPDKTMEAPAPPAGPTQSSAKPPEFGWDFDSKSGKMSVKVGGEERVCVVPSDAVSSASVYRDGQNVRVNFERREPGGLKAYDLSLPEFCAWSFTAPRPSPSPTALPAIRECDAGFRLEGGNCVRVNCPSGQQLQAGACRPIVCSAGQVLQGNSCIALPTLLVTASASRWCTTRRSYSLRLEGDKIVWTDSGGSVDVERIVSDEVSSARTVTQKSVHSSGDTVPTGTVWTYSSGGKNRISVSKSGGASFWLTRC